MFRTYPITVVRIAAICLVLFYLLNLSSEVIKVSAAEQQSIYLLRDLLRYFLLLVASLGFWKLYQASLGRVGKWVVLFTTSASIFGIAAYFCLSLDLLLAPAKTWQTSLLAFFEFLKSEFATQFQQMLGGKQSFTSWLRNSLMQLQLQFLPQASDFPIGVGWIKLYLLFKLLASVFFKIVIVLGLGMFLFPRPLSKGNLLIATLILLWLLSPIFGSSFSVIAAWLLQSKPVNGEAVKSLVALIIFFLIAMQMWLDAGGLQQKGRSKVKKKPAAKPKKNATKSKRSVQRASK